MIERINVKGRLILIFEREGRIINVIDTGWNLIVNDGRKAIAKLVYGATLSAWQPSRMYAGLSDENLNVTNTDLASRINVPLSNFSISDLGNGMVQFTAVVPDTNYFNGKTLKEAGLFYVQNTNLFLFSRKIHKPYTKQSGTTVSYNWTISF